MNTEMNSGGLRTPKGIRYLVRRLLARYRIPFGSKLSQMNARNIAVSIIALHLIGLPLLASGICKRLERIAHGAPNTKEQFLSALEGPVLSDPGVATFLNRFTDLPKKREIAKTLVAPPLQKELERLVIIIELAQNAEADRITSKAKGTSRSLPELTKDYDGKVGLTLGSAFINLYHDMTANNYSPEARRALLQSVMRLTCDTDQERQFLTTVIESPLFQNEFKLVQDYMEGWSSFHGETQSALQELSKNK